MDIEKHPQSYYTFSFTETFLAMDKTEKYMDIHVILSQLSCLAAAETENRECAWDVRYMQLDCITVEKFFKKVGMTPQSQDHQQY